MTFFFQSLMIKRKINQQNKKDKVPYDIPGRHTQDIFVFLLQHSLPHIIIIIYIVMITGNYF